LTENARLDVVGRNLCNARMCAALEWTKFEFVYITCNLAVSLRKLLLKNFEWVFCVFQDFV